MNAKVLIVDDSGLARRMTKTLLEEIGCSVEEASEGSQALERFVLHQYDVVLLDVVMPGMNGLEVLKKLKELKPNAPVIMATSDIQRATREEAKAYGAAALINKPLRKDELESVLATVLEGGAFWN